MQELEDQRAELELRLERAGRSKDSLSLQVEQLTEKLDGGYTHTYIHTYICTCTCTQNNKVSVLVGHFVEFGWPVLLHILVRGEQLEFWKCEWGGHVHVRT